MIAFLTCAEVLEEAEIISGVLINGSPGRATGLFSGNVICSGRDTWKGTFEIPKPVGGIGETSQGKSVSEFTSKLQGKIEYPIPTKESVLHNIAENRIQLLVKMPHPGFEFPVFLSTEGGGTLERWSLVIDPAIWFIRELADVRVFAGRHRCIQRLQQCEEPISPKMVLPLSYGDSDEECRAAMAVEVWDRNVGARAIGFHIGNHRPVRVGDRLWRRAHWNEVEGSGDSKLSATVEIGKVLRVGSAID